MRNIAWIRDKNIVVTLLSSFKVRYNGTIYSLKELSSALLGREIKYKELASLWCSKSGTLLKDLNVFQGGL